MNSYPHTIDNGRGERLTFLRREATESGGERLIVENRVSPASGPPMHVHYFQREGLTVEQGRIGYATRDGEERFGGPGDSVTFEAGEWHRFWNAGDEDLVCSGFIEPPDNIEYFLGGIYEAQKKSSHPERPDPTDSAFLMWKYRDEFGIAGIPAFVQKVLIPIQVRIAGWAGKLKHFGDAPPARSR